MTEDEDKYLSFEDELKPELTDREKQVLNKFARWIVSMGFTTPAIVMFQSAQPIGFLGSQLFLFFEPFVRIIPGTAGVSRMRSGLGKREGIEYLLQQIEQEEANRRNKNDKT